MREGRNLFQACQHGGCTACLSPEQMRCFRALHSSLSVLIKRYDPAKKNISGLPLTFMLESEKRQLTRVFMLMFRTYVDNLEAIFLELVTDQEFGAEPPLTLNMLHRRENDEGTVGCQNDLATCKDLASVAMDWKLSRLTLGDLRDDLYSFHVLEKIPEDIASLQRAAEELKEQERALRAVRLLQRLQRRRRRPAAAPRGQRRGRGRGRGRRGGRGRAVAEAGAEEEEEGLQAGAEAEDADADDEAESDAWGEAGVSGGDEDDDEDDVWVLRQPGARAADPSAARGPRIAVPAGEAAEEEEAAPPAPPPPAVPRPARNRPRSIPWGPFLFSPIVPQDGRQTGWGALCNLHRDRGEGCSRTRCKKAVSYGIVGMDDAECIIRLKRWLCAGLDDSDFPVDRQRSHHVSLGDAGLMAFDRGLSEDEMDAMIARRFHP